MKNDIRIATFSVRHDLGPMFMGVRDANNELVMQQLGFAPRNVPFAGIPARIKQFESSLVELMDANLYGTTPEERAEFREALERENVTVAMVGLSRCVGDANDTNRAEDLDAVEQLIDSAVEVKAESVRVVLMPPPIVESPALAPFDDLVNGLRRLSAYAKTAGVRLTVENDDVVTSDPEQLIPILDAVGSDVGFVLDTGNIEPILSELSASFAEDRAPRDVADPEPAYRIFEDLLPRAEVVHVKTYGFNEDGSSKVYDVNRIISILAKSNFEGPLTIEYGGYEGADADGAISKTIELIRAA
ncbi:sugar phosphate isomerase/epimerase family protein [Arthrobacter sp. SD76]|uniref:sugar phosphate isomerase/epimerase family protein n=1 Tax=Arthrobacter sp. SD76 TaxID=3415007 RepID=UPI003C76AD6A